MNVSSDPAAAFSFGPFSSPTPTAVALAVVALTIGWFLTARKKKKSISLALQKLPHIPSPWPFVGVGVEYFSKGPYPFCHKWSQRLGKTFVAELFGRPWIFCADQQDLAAIVRAPEKHVSMLKASYNLVGFTFPQESLADYPSMDVMHKISSRNGAGPSGTPMFIQALRKEKLEAWIPALRSLLQEAFADLPETGSTCLFDLCQNLISSITVRVLLGDVVRKDKSVLQRFVKLFNEGDPEAGFSGPVKSFGTMLETSILGERFVFRKVRALLYPILDEEIERICVQNAPETDGESVMQNFVRQWYAKLNQDVNLVRCAKRRIVNDMFLFTFAAFTNSYAGTAWLIYHMLKNTAGVGDKIRAEAAELQERFQSQESRVGDFNCPHLEWTLFEITRLYTPGSLLREVVTPFTLPSTGVEVPAGVTLNLSVSLSHRDPECYSDPLKFDPLRHAPGGSARGKMMSFGAGAHVCPGRRFAVYEMALFAVEMMNAFDFDLVDDNLPPTDEFTKSVIGEDDKNHPRLDPTQPGFLWRPLDPLMVQFTRKHG